MLLLLTSFLWAPLVTNRLLKQGESLTSKGEGGGGGLKEEEMDDFFWLRLLPGLV